MSVYYDQSFVSPDDGYVSGFSIGLTHYITGGFLVFNIMVNDISVYHYYLHTYYGPISIGYQIFSDENKIPISLGDRVSFYVYSNGLYLDTAVFPAIQKIQLDVFTEFNTLSASSFPPPPS